MSSDTLSSAPPDTAAARDAMGGQWVLVVGPSGVGKDTLINLARNALAGQPKIQFARRIVTRAKNAFEDHDTVTPAQFSDLEKAGTFALSWSAHGLSYGVARRWAQAVADGRIVVCNVSRTIVEDARRRYGRVATVLVTAPDDVLAARIKARGRDVGPASRTTRDLNALVESQAQLIIQNTATAEAGAEQLIDFLVSLCGQP